MRGEERLDFSLLQDNIFFFSLKITSIVFIVVLNLEMMHVHWEEFENFKENEGK